jgi:hypothetical protein
MPATSVLVAGSLAQVSRVHVPVVRERVAVAPRAGPNGRSSTGSYAVLVMRARGNTFILE